MPSCNVSNKCCSVSVSHASNDCRRFNNNHCSRSKYVMAFLTYVAVSLLSIFVTPNKEAAVIFILFFGHYPIIKQKLESIHTKLLKWILKFIIFNICIVIDYQITLHLLGIDDFADDFAMFGKFGIYILWFLTNIIFIVYDYALSGCIEMYIKYLKPKIFGSKKK